MLTCAKGRVLGIPEIIIRPNTNAGGCLFGGIFFACHVVSAANLREREPCLHAESIIPSK